MLKVTFASDSGRLNVPNETAIEHVSLNIRRGLPQAAPHNINPDVAVIVAGGPSLKQTLPELREAVFRGGKIVALNGAYNWCIERNFKPSACVILDAREFCHRFIEEPVPGCRYLLASQCHPKVFETCRGRDAILWHACSGGQAELDLIQQYFFNQVHVISLGTSVGVRAISLLRLLGFVKFDIFGLDSCWLDGQHHAYYQPENADQDIEMFLKAKDSDEAYRFVCAPWMAKQFEDFLELVRKRGDLFRLSVHGPGLIATALKLGAELAVEQRPLAVAAE